MSTGGTVRTPERVQLGLPAGAGGSASILVVDDDPLILDVVAAALDAAGYDVVTAEDGRQALDRVAEVLPDLIVSDLEMPHMDGLELLRALREDRLTRGIPFVFLTTRGRVEDVIAGLHLGADDYVPKPFELSELVARVRSKLERRPVPADAVPTDARTGLLAEAAFRAEVDRETRRVARGGRPCSLACLANAELGILRDRLGPRAEAELARQLAAVLADETEPLDVLGRDGDGRFMILLPETDAARAQDRLQALSEAVVRRRFRAGGETVRLTPTIGFAAGTDTVDAGELWRRAVVAAEHAAAHLDLRPAQHEPGMDVAPPAPRGGRLRAALEHGRVPFQIALTQVAGIVVPFALYLWLDSIGLDVAPVMYLVVVAALLLTSLLIWAEGFAALRRPEPPEEPGAPAPPASAIIAAYLPNEASTV